jgi:hypothetical protein
VFVRRLGFAPARAPITVSAGDIDSVHVTLRAIAQPLPQITVEDAHDSLSRKMLADFWTRRSRGFGRFLTRDEIADKRATQLVDVVRNVPGVRILMARGRPDIRFRGAGMGSPRDCPPQYWLDGIPLQYGVADEFTAENIEAIELYSGPATTPPQFNTRTPTCGTVVVWSRLPG